MVRGEKTVGFLVVERGGENTSTSIPKLYVIFFKETRDTIGGAVSDTRSA